MNILLRAVLLWLTCFTAGTVKGTATPGNIVAFATCATLFALSMGWLWP